MKTIHIQYFALLREQAGSAQQSLKTAAATPGELYRQLQGQHGFSLDQASLRAVVNEEFSAWDRTLQDGDHVVFIPPVAGG